MLCRPRANRGVSDTLNVLCTTSAQPATSKKKEPHWQRYFSASTVVAQPYVLF
jgi:hypothetical protein